jgi:tRNA G18 (ribose-2'-O)-methylase SpoU
MNLSPKDVEDATKALESIINNDRLERVRTVLGQRTKNCKFLFENPNNPSNVWACLRTIDSFGIQDVDLVIESGIYQGKQSLSTKRGMRTAMGSAQWYVFMSVCMWFHHVLYSTLLLCAFLICQQMYIYVKVITSESSINT